MIPRVIKFVHPDRILIGMIRQFRLKGQMARNGRGVARMLRTAFVERM